MPVVVDVRTPDDFKKWVDEQKAQLKQAAAPAADVAPLGPSTELKTSRTRHLKRHRTWPKISRTTTPTTPMTITTTRPTGIKRWLFSTNHKDIGTMYLVFSLIMFFIGGSMAMVIRAELFKPGLQLVDPERFNQMTTMHALVMIFGAVMPSFVGLANWMVPLQIGAPDMALPRMNNLSFWILPFAFTLLLSARSSCRAAHRPPAGRCIRRWCCRAATPCPC